MNKIIMHWVCNKVPNNLTLHSLYTSIRFINQKSDLSNQKEEFKIWKDGRNIFIILDESLIENKSNEFIFCHNTVICKLINKTNYHNHPHYLKFKNKLQSEIEPIFTLSGAFIYTYKYKKDNSKGFIETCPIDLKGEIKNYAGNNKNLFLDYLEKETGLAFNQYSKRTEKIRFERIFTDEKVLYEKINDGKEIDKKILFKNIILVHATLPVINKNATDKLIVNSIGKKRNYGFGSFTLE
jgi:hypothetical protein